LDKEPKDLAEFFDNIKETQEKLQKRIDELESRLETFEQEKPYGAPYGVAFFRAILRFIDKIKPKDLDDLKAKLRQMIGEGETIELNLEEGEQARFIAAEDEADCRRKGGQWKAGRCLIIERAGGEKAYPAPAIAKLLEYLNRNVGKQLTKRMVTYIASRILGVTKKGELLTEEERKEVDKLMEEWETMEKTEKLKQTGEIISVLPQQIEDFNVYEQEVKETVDLWLSHGLEHQKKKEGETK